MLRRRSRCLAPKKIGRCPKAAGARVIGCPSRATDAHAKGATMPKYLCLQRSLGTGEGNGDKPSPAEMQAMYEKFNAWREKFKDNLVDLGGRLGKSKSALPEPLPDGPLVEVKELVGGYMI